MESIKNKLLELEDKEYQEFNSKLCPDTNHKILGIRVPVLRNLAKEILKEKSLDEILEEIDNEYFEEILLEGLCIAYSKMSFKEKEKYIESFVPKIDSWAISDTFIPTIKPKKNELEEAWNFILPYVKSEKEFEIRFAVVMMLDYFVNEEYLERVIKQIDSIHHEGYYVKMGVAWLVAEIAIKHYDRAIVYLKNNNLDDFTHNKSIQKMIESYRITKEQKDYLRTLKRKK